MARMLDPSNQRTHHRWTSVVWVVASLLLPLFAATPALADHEPITIDGSLTDLIGAISRNTGPDRGGYALPDPQGEGYTSSCGYVNGFDVRNYYFFLDFAQAGNGAPDSVRLYGGWDVYGVIGDVDGDGNPNTFTIPRPGCAVPSGEGTGIGPLESYTIDFDFTCEGDPDMRIAVTGNGVKRVLPLPMVDISSRSTFVFNGTFLELRVNQLRDLVPAGFDLCDARIRMTANAELDGPGEDRSTIQTLAILPLVSVTKLPAELAICPGDTVSLTLNVVNNGLCALQSVLVTDVLGDGLTYLSSEPVADRVVGQQSEWDFTNLGSGETRSILVRAVVGPTCTEPLANNVNVDGTYTPVASCRPSQLAADDALTSLTCSPNCVECDITITPGPVVCAGTPVELCGPEGNFTYLWTLPNGSTQSGRCLSIPAPTAANSGGYRLTVTPPGGAPDTCSAKLTVIEIPCAITGPSAICAGQSLQLCGPAGSYSYRWTRPDGSTVTTTDPCFTFTNPTTGTYSLVVTDPTSGCSSTVCTKFVTVNPPPNCNITGPTGPVCPGTRVELCAPTGNFTYLWTLPGGGTATTRCVTIPAAASTHQGTYSVVVTDVATGCASTPCTFNLQVGTPPACSITGPTGPVCPGTPVELCAPTGNFTYRWTLPGGATVTTRCVTIPAAQAANAGTYSLVVTDAATGCASTSCSYTLQVGTPPACSITGPPGPVCAGSPVELCGPTGNYTYRWTLPNGSIVTTRCINIAAVQTSHLGPYSLVVTDAATGCASAPCNYSLQLGTTPVCSIKAPGGPVCAGTPVELCGPTGNYTYRWTLPGGAIVTTRCVSIPAAQTANAGTYSLVVTDGVSGCASAPCTYTLALATPPACSITGPSTSVCPGSPVELCGPTGSFNYRWTLPGGGIVTTRCVTIPAVQSSHAGPYTLVVIDPVTGCESTPCSYKLTLSTPPVCNIVGPTGPVCAGARVELCAPTGNFTYRWTLPGGAIVTTRCVTIPSVQAGNTGAYTLVMTDLGTGCSSAPCSYNLQIGTPPACSITGPTGPVCAGSPVELCGPTGNFTYRWTLPGGAIVTTRCVTIPAVQAAHAGAYSLVVTDVATGCAGAPCTYDLRLGPPPACSITGPTGPVCAGLPAELCGPTGSYTYRWTLPNGSIVTTRCVSIAAVQTTDLGPYSLVVTDAATGCASAPCSYSLQLAPPAPCSIKGPGPVCAGTPVELCGPTGNYTYRWTLPGGAVVTTRCVTIPSAQSANAGTYTLVVTDGVSGCASAPCTYELELAPSLPCSITGPSGPVCLGSRVELCGPTGNLTYRWTLPNGNVVTTRCVTIASLQNSHLGSYTLVVTDPATGCESTPCATKLTLATPPPCNITGPSAPVCDGARVELCAPTGNFTYLWTLPGGGTVTTRCVTIPSVQAGNTGTYTLVVTDAVTGCSSPPCTYQLSIGNPPPCYATAKPSGPVAPGTRVEICGPMSSNLDYRWTLPNGSIVTTRCVIISSASLADAGTYSLEVTDRTTGCKSGGKGCEVTLEVIEDCKLTLVKKAKPSVIETPPPPDCKSGGKPTSLTFRYTRQSCKACRHEQSWGKVSCTDYGSLPSKARIIITDSGWSGSGRELFDGYVSVGTTFKANASTAGLRWFPSTTYVYIYDGSKLVQKVKFQTSCYQPLKVGDQFGALALVGFNGKSDSEGAQVTYEYLVTNYGGSIVDATLTDDKLGVIAADFDLAPGQTRSFTKVATITQTTTNVATVVGHLGSPAGPKCQASDKFTVTVKSCLQLAYDDNSDDVSAGVASEVELEQEPGTLGPLTEGLARVEFGIHGSFPNPTAGSTTIRYGLPRSGSVQLSIHDVQGRQVANVVQGVVEAGEHSVSWSGRGTDGRRLPTGIYMIRLQSEEGVRTGKLVLVN